MRILYVAPRYHSNQIPIMKGWLEEGSEVLFVSQFASEHEDYHVLRPRVLGYSRLFEAAAKTYRMIFCRNEKNKRKEFDFRSKLGFAPLGATQKIIKSFRPDLVILRDRSVYNIPFARYCKHHDVPCILYNQTALCGENTENLSPGKRLFRALLPSVRMTPVMRIDSSDRTPRQNEFFVPFVQEVWKPYDEKPHLADGKIQILCVARYEKRKNLLMLVEAFSQVRNIKKAHLTIVGELQHQDQKEYLRKLQELISRLGLESDVTPVTNCERDRVYEYYWNADLFVLPSTKERASISQLEAMSCGLPVICSNTNGTACYVTPGVNGDLFIDNDVSDLREKLDALLSDADRLILYGKNSYDLVVNNYQFANYKAALEKMGFVHA